MKIWGYKADGSAQIFDLADDEDFPVGWSDDITVILDDAHRHGDHLSKAAGHTLHKHAKGVKIVEKKPVKKVL